MDVFTTGAPLLCVAAVLGVWLGVVEKKEWPAVVFAAIVAAGTCAAVLVLAGNAAAIVEGTSMVHATPMIRLGAWIAVTGVLVLQVVTIDRRAVVSTAAAAGTVIATPVGAMFVTAAPWGVVVAVAALTGVVEAVWVFSLRAWRSLSSRSEAWGALWFAALIVLIAELVPGLIRDLAIVGTWCAIVMWLMCAVAIANVTRWGAWASVAHAVAVGATSSLVMWTTLRSSWPSLGWRELVLTAAVWALACGTMAFLARDRGWYWRRVVIIGTPPLAMLLARTAAELMWSAPQ